MVAIAPPPGDPKDLPAWLASFTNWEKQLPLGQERREWGPLRCRKLLDRLHLDTSQQRVIQVAGSKGKGSTVLWLESLLSIRGQTTAATTSPHLISLEERIRLNGEQVSFPRLLAGLHKIYPALIAGQSAGDPLPTFFDLWTALFTEIAVSEGVENILLEVGLGGPLDSTTAIPHDLGILTTIDLEHTALLGDTCEKIAAEKSKIARSGKPFMISSGETAGTAEQIARTLQSSPSISCEDSRIPDSVPSHQKLNGATALQALEQQFIGSMEDDLNSSGALAVLFDLAKPLRALANRLERGDEPGLPEADIQNLAPRWQLLRELAVVLGLRGETSGQSNLDDASIDAAIAARKAAKAAKDYAEADRIRNELTAQGIELIDKPGGITEWIRS